MQLGQAKLVELVYNVGRAQFNAENPDDASVQLPTFENVGSDVREAITADIRNFYESGIDTGSVVVDAVLNTFR